MLPIRRKNTKKTKLKSWAGNPVYQKKRIHKICILVRAYRCQFMVWQFRRSYPSTVDELPAPLIKFEIPQEFHTDRKFLSIIFSMLNVTIAVLYSCLSIKTRRLGPSNLYDVFWGLPFHDDIKSDSMTTSNQMLSVSLNQLGTCPTLEARILALCSQSLHKKWCGT